VTVEILLAFAATEAALSLIPGPAVLVVVSQGMTGGRAPSAWAALGVIAGNLLCFAISATGVGALLLASYDLFFAVKWAGAAYLIYLGVKTWRAPPEATFAPSDVGGRHRGGSSFMHGFLTQAANPKSILFFAALLPQFVDPGGDVTVQLALLGGVSIAIELPILFAYGRLGGQALRLAARPRLFRLVHRGAGSLLVLAGVGLAALRRAEG